MLLSEPLLPELLLELLSPLPLGFESDELLDALALLLLPLLLELSWPGTRETRRDGAAADPVVWPCWAADRSAEPSCVILSGCGVCEGIFSEFLGVTAITFDLNRFITGRAGVVCTFICIAPTPDFFGAAAATGDILTEARLLVGITKGAEDATFIDDCSRGAGCSPPGEGLRKGLLPDLRSFCAMRRLVIREVISGVRRASSTALKSLSNLSPSLSSDSFISSARLSCEGSQLNFSSSSFRLCGDSASAGAGVDTGVSFALLMRIAIFDSLSCT